MSYTQTVKLEDNQSLAKVDNDTGEVKPVTKKLSNIPDNKLIFEPDALFRKDYNKSWEYLDSVLTPLEFKVVAKLCRMAKMNTNSLEPLNDDTTIQSIAEEFSIGRNKVTPLFNKLYKFGVYAKFEVVKTNVPYTKYWILNPYLSFAGKLIHSDIAKLFIGTMIEKQFHL